MRKSTCLLPTVLFHLATGLCLVGMQSGIAAAQGEILPSSSGSGGFFSRELGTALRFNYHTNGYGVQEDVVSLGAMKVFNMQGATAFLDGQGTLSDDFGGGFNLGVGYRQLTTLGMQYDPERILGVGFWTDGQSTAADNFFTQLGFSLESLGDSYDVRLNGYFPLDGTQTGDPVLSDVNSAFSGNNLFSATERFTIDSAHNVVDGEIAKRIGNLEAWGFAGAYQLGGNGGDATGYRLGVRGYAVPDFAVSMEVTEDDVYGGNLMVGATWFIGRTHKGNAPCGTLLDRFREPVIRNNFIATTQRRESRASGDALMIDGSTDLVSIVHVDSSADAGGDGTFENPYMTLAEANGAGSAANDIILVHGGSTFTGADGQITLQENQRLLGEGVDQDGSTVTHSVATTNGTIPLPETATGAQALARPDIDAMAAAGSVIDMADGTAVDNFTISNATTAISASGITVPTGNTISNVQIQSSVTGISLANVMGEAVINSNVLIDGSTGTGLLIDGGNESITMNGSIRDTTGMSLHVQNRTGGTVSFAGTIDDDFSVVGNSTGVLIENNTDATVSFDAASVLDIHVDGATDRGLLVQNNMGTTVTGAGAVDVTASGDAQAVRFEGNDNTSALTLSDLNASAINGNTVDIQGPGSVAISSVTTTDPDRGIANTGTGNAFFNDGTGGSAVLTVNSNINNTGSGAAVQLADRAEANNATFNGTIDATGTAGVIASNNTDGTIAFNGAMTLNSGASDAVALTTNAGATFQFNDMDIDTTNGNGFVATGGGTLSVASTGNNSIDVTGTGVGVNLNGMTIDGANVTFDTVNVGNGAGVGIDLQNLDGTGQVALGGGTNAGDGGTLTTAGIAINVDNADNVSLTNFTVSNSAGAGGVSVTGQQAGSTANFAGLNVTTADADAVNVSGNTDGTIIFTDLTATTTGTGGGVVALNNANATLSIDDMTVSATGTGAGFSATGTGSLAVTGTTSIETAGGKILNVVGQNISANSTFGTVGLIDPTDTVTGTAVELRDLTGSNVTVGSGTAAGDGGTLRTTGAGTAAMIVDNVAGATINNITVDNSATNGGGVSVVNNTAGTRSFSRLEVTTQDEAALEVSSNSGGTNTFSNLVADKTSATAQDAVVIQNNTAGTTTINTGTVTVAGSGDGVVANNNGNATTNLNSLDVTTDSGVGILVTGTGNTTSGGTGTVTTTTGIGVDILNAENATLSGLTVSSGAADTVRVQHTDGATSDVTLNALTIANAANNGVSILSNGTGEFDIAITNSNITTTGAGNEAVVYDLGAAHTGRSDLTLTGSTLIADADNAFQATLDQGTGDVRFLIQQNTNLSGDVAGGGAVDISVTSGLALSATIGNTVTSDDTDSQAVPDSVGDFNLFTNSNAGGDPFRMEVNDAGATINLDLRDNTAAGGSVSYQLFQTNGTFNLVDRVDTLAGDNNIGTVVEAAGTTIQIAPPVSAPTP